MGFLDKLLGRKKDDAAESTETAPVSAPPADTMPTGEQPHEHDHDHDQPHEHDDQ